MKISTKQLTTLSIFTAIQVILLIICMSIPSARLSLLCVISAIHGLFYRAGYKVSHILISFIAVSVISYIFMMNPTTYLAYVCFFGLYGIIHHLFRFKSFWVKQLIRWSYFILALGIGYLILTLLINAPFVSQVSIYLLLAAMIAGFAVFQFAYELVITIVLNHPYLRKLFFNN